MEIKRDNGLLSSLNSFRPDSISNNFEDEIDIILNECTTDQHINQSTFLRKVAEASAPPTYLGFSPINGSDGYNQRSETNDSLPGSLFKPNEISKNLRRLSGKSRILSKQPQPLMKRVTVGTHHSHDLNKTKLTANLVTSNLSSRRDGKKIIDKYLGDSTAILDDVLLQKHNNGKDFTFNWQKTEQLNGADVQHSKNNLNSAPVVNLSTQLIKEHKGLLRANRKEPNSVKSMFYTPYTNLCDNHSQVSREHLKVIVQRQRETRRLERKQALEMEHTRRERIKNNLKATAMAAATAAKNPVLKKQTVSSAKETAKNVAVVDMQFSSLPPNTYSREREQKLNELLNLDDDLGQCLSTRVCQSHSSNFNRNLHIHIPEFAELRTSTESNGLQSALNESNLNSVFAHNPNIHFINNNKSGPVLQDQLTNRFNGNFTSVLSFNTKNSLESGKRLKVVRQPIVHGTTHVTVDQKSTAKRKNVLTKKKVLEKSGEKCAKVGFYEDSLTQAALLNIRLSAQRAKRLLMDSSDCLAHDDDDDKDDDGVDDNVSDALSSINSSASACSNRWMRLEAVGLSGDSEMEGDDGCFIDDFKDEPDLDNHFTVKFKPVEHCAMEPKDTVLSFSPDSRDLMYNDPFRFVEVYQKQNGRTIGNVPRSVYSTGDTKHIETTYDISKNIDFFKSKSPNETLKSQCKLEKVCLTPITISKHCADSISPTAISSSQSSPLPSSSLSSTTAAAPDMNLAQEQKFLSDAAKGAMSSTPRRQTHENRVMFRSSEPRFTPAALSLQLTAEMNNFEALSSSIQHLADMQSLRQFTMAQAETVGLAQLLKARETQYLSKSGDEINKQISSTTMLETDKEHSLHSPQFQGVLKAAEEFSKVERRLNMKMAKLDSNNRQSREIRHNQYQHSELDECCENGTAAMSSSQSDDQIYSEVDTAVDDEITNDHSSTKLGLLIKSASFYESSPRTIVHTSSSAADCKSHLHPRQSARSPDYKRSRATKSLISTSPQKTVKQNDRQPNVAAVQFDEMVQHVLNEREAALKYRKKQAEQLLALSKNLDLEEMEVDRLEREALKAIQFRHDNNRPYCSADPSIKKTGKSKVPPTSESTLPHHTSTHLESIHLKQVTADQSAHIEQVQTTPMAARSSPVGKSEQTNSVASPSLSDYSSNIQTISAASGLASAKCSSDQSQASIINSVKKNDDFKVLNQLLTHQLSTKTSINENPPIKKLLNGESNQKSTLHLLDGTTQRQPSKRSINSNAYDSPLCSNRPNDEELYSTTLSTNSHLDLSELESRIQALNSNLKKQESILYRINRDYKHVHKDRLVRLESTLLQHKQLCTEIIANIKSDLDHCKSSICTDSSDVSRSVTLGSICKQHSISRSIGHDCQPALLTHDNCDDSEANTLVSIAEEFATPQDTDVELNQIELDDDCCSLTPTIQTKLIHKDEPLLSSTAFSPDNGFKPVALHQEFTLTSSGDGKRGPLDKLFAGIESCVPQLNVTQSSESKFVSHAGVIHEEQFCHDSLIKLLDQSQFINLETIEHNSPTLRTVEKDALALPTSLGSNQLDTVKLESGVIGGDGLQITAVSRSVVKQQSTVDGKTDALVEQLTNNLLNEVLNEAVDGVLALWKFKFKIIKTIPAKILDEDECFDDDDDDDDDDGSNEIVPLFHDHPTPFVDEKVPRLNLDLVEHNGSPTSPRTPHNVDDDDDDNDDDSSRVDVEFTKDVQIEFTPAVVQGLVAYVPNRIQMLIQLAVEYLWSSRSNARRPDQREEALRLAGSHKKPVEFGINYFDEADLNDPQVINNPNAQYISRSLLFDLILEIVCSIYTGEDDQYRYEQGLSNKKPPRVTSEQFKRWRGPRRPATLTQLLSIVQSEVALRLDPNSFSAPNQSTSQSDLGLPGRPTISKLARWMMANKESWVERMIEWEMRCDESNWFAYAPEERLLKAKLADEVWADVWEDAVQSVLNNRPSTTVKAS